MGRAARDRPAHRVRESGCELVVVELGGRLPTGHGSCLGAKPNPQGIIAALDALGFPAVRRPTPPGGSSLVGVWRPDYRKIASIGMRIRGGVSSHGFDLNVDPNMTAFDQFVACGLADPITSLQALAEERGGKVPAEAEVRDALAGAMRAVLPAHVRPPRRT